MMRTIGYGLGFVLVLMLGCDQQASIGERGDAAVTHGSDGGVTCDLPTCGNYVFPPSPRLARVVERSAGGSSRTMLDLRYNSMGESSLMKLCQCCSRFGTRTKEAGSRRSNLSEMVFGVPKGLSLGMGIAFSALRAFRPMIPSTTRKCAPLAF